MRSLTWQSYGILPGSALGEEANVTVTFDQAGHPSAGGSAGWTGWPG